MVNPTPIAPARVDALTALENLIKNPPENSRVFEITPKITASRLSIWPSLTCIATDHQSSFAGAGPEVFRSGHRPSIYSG